MDRLHALSSRRGTTGCRQRGKCSVCNNIHMFRVIGSLAFESLLKTLRGGGGGGGGWGNIVTLNCPDLSLNPSRTDMLLLDTTAA